VQNRRIREKYRLTSTITTAEAAPYASNSPLKRLAVPKLALLGGPGRYARTSTGEIAAIDPSWDCAGQVELTRCSK
jgi:hypothetical protein